MTVDVDRLISTFYRDQDEVTDLVGDRGVVTILPDTKTFPIVRLTVLDAVPITKPLHLERALVQHDCYGTTKAEARLIADTLREVAEDRLDGRHDLGVVTWHEFRSMRYRPDPTFEPAQPRWVFDMTVSTRPTESS